jgi:uncharacterized protein involved in oxidation of intracellular sulfur
MDKLLLVVTHATDDSERATVPFVIGTTALVSDMEATILLQMEGAWLSKKGQAQLVNDPAFPPLADLMAKFVEAGGRILVCGPCAKKRALKQEDMVEGITIVNAPSIVQAIAESKSVLVY